MLESSGQPGVGKSQSNLKRGSLAAMLGQILSDLQRLSILFQGGVSFAGFKQDIPRQRIALSQTILPLDVGLVLIGQLTRKFETLIESLDGFWIGLLGGEQLLSELQMLFVHIAHGFETVLKESGEFGFLILLNQRAPHS